MAVVEMKSSSSSSSSIYAYTLPPPCPRSPPKYPPDFSGRRRELSKVQMLEREIGFLQDELKSVEGLQLASRNCKEVDDFVVANPDPLIPTSRKIRKPRHFWKWLCCGNSCLISSRNSCFNLSWICCFSGCFHNLQTSNCCSCCPPVDWNCRCLRCRCNPCCLRKICCKNCGIPTSSCLGCSPSCKCKCPCPCSCSCPCPCPFPCLCPCPKCTDCVCPNCTKNACNLCC